jgi:hypothetical protein
MEQAPDEMVRPGQSRPDFLFEHGLQYGQDWPYRQFPNDFNLTARKASATALFSVLILEPPEPRSLWWKPKGSESRSALQLGGVQAFIVMTRFSCND